MGRKEGGWANGDRRRAAAGRPLRLPRRGPVRARPHCHGRGRKPPQLPRPSTVPRAIQEAVEQGAPRGGGYEVQRCTPGEARGVALRLLKSRPGSGRRRSCATAPGRIRTSRDIDPPPARRHVGERPDRRPEGRPRDRPIRRSPRVVRHVPQASPRARPGAHTQKTRGATAQQPRPGGAGRLLLRSVQPSAQTRLPSLIGVMGAGHSCMRPPAPFPTRPASSRATPETSSGI